MNSAQTMMLTDNTATGSVVLCVLGRGNQYALGGDAVDADIDRCNRISIFGCEVGFRGDAALGATASKYCNSYVM